jgi:penicillin-binding protein 2
VILLSDQQKKRILHDIAMNKKFVPVPVAENLTWEEFSRVNLHLPYLPGIQCDVGETRDYPFGAMSPLFRPRRLRVTTIR